MIENKRLAIFCASAIALVSISACSKPPADTAATTESTNTETAPAATDAATNTAASTPAPAAGPTPEETALLASLPAPYKDGDIANGKRQFAVCSTCHSIADGAPNKVGPNLHGIIGKKAGMNPTFTYSDGLKSSGKTWDAATLDTYLKNPKAMFTDSKMAYAGMPADNNRRDVIAYLAVATAK